MFQIDPKILFDTRIQLHWASQLLSAAADAKLAPLADDSHSNLEWDAAANEMVGRAGCRIGIPKFEMSTPADSFTLTGKSLDESRAWLGEKLGAEINFRDYDMPEHPVESGAVFSPNPDQLLEIAKWFSFAEKTLAGNGELRIWPHHFDMGFWSPGEIEGKSIGGGFSVGDQQYQQPYFYINPYGIEKPESLPHLDFGFWTEHWLGAVLVSDEIISADQPESVSSGFVSSALEACQGLIARAGS